MGSVMWNMLELPMFGQSVNRVCEGVGVRSSPPLPVLADLMHTRFAADGFLFYLVTVCCVKS